MHSDTWGTTPGRHFGDLLGLRSSYNSQRGRCGIRATRVRNRKWFGSALGGLWGLSRGRSKGSPMAVTKSATMKPPEPSKHALGSGRSPAIGGCQPYGKLTSQRAGQQKTSLVRHPLATRVAQILAGPVQAFGTAAPSRSRLAHGGEPSTTR